MLVDCMYVVRYEKELRSSDAYLGAYQRLEAPLSPKQLAVFAGAQKSASYTQLRLHVLHSSTTGAISY